MHPLGFPKLATTTCHSRPISSKKFNRSAILETFQRKRWNGLSTRWRDCPPARLTSSHNSCSCVCLTRTSGGKHWGWLHTTFRAPHFSFNCQFRMQPVCTRSRRGSPQKSKRLRAKGLQQSRPRSHVTGNLVHHRKRECIGNDRQAKPSRQFATEHVSTVTHVA